MSLNEIAAKYGLTDEQVKKVLEQHAKAAERRKERGTTYNPDATRKAYERMKERMSADPEYAEKVRKQRASYTRKRNETIKAALTAYREFQSQQ